MPLLGVSYYLPPGHIANMDTLMLSAQRDAMLTGGFTLSTYLRPENTHTHTQKHTQTNIAHTCWEPV